MFAVKLLIVLCLSLSLPSHSPPLVSGDGDSVIKSLKPIVPRFCWGSFLTIRCFELCSKNPRQTEDKDALDEEEGAVNIFPYLVYVYRAGLVQLDDIEHFFSVKRKCLSDPEYWSCIAECDLADPTVYWDRDCDDSCKTDISLPECQSCCRESTRKQLLSTCPLAHHPNHKHPENYNLCMLGCDASLISQQEAESRFVSLISSCFLTQNEPSTLGNPFENISQCVNDKVMLNVRDCCYREEFRKASECGADDKACDDFCMRTLSTRMCKAKCSLLRDPRIKRCKEEAKLKFPTDPDPCHHCTDNATYVRMQEEKRCVENCTMFNCSVACMSGTGAFNASHMRINCRQHKYLIEMSEEMEEVGELFKKSKIKNLKDTIWIPAFKTPLECQPGENCYEEMGKLLNGQERGEVCTQNPFRQLDFIACIIYLNITDVSHSNMRHAADLFRREDCLNKSGEIRLKLYNLSYQYEHDFICRKTCRTPEQGSPQFNTHPMWQSLVSEIMFLCQKNEQGPLCTDTKLDDNIIQLTDFATCRWELDFSRAEDPYTVWETYFNELEPIQAKTLLEHPDTTKILQKARYKKKVDFYAFPYFLIFRSVCDSHNGHYDDDAYRFFMMGESPLIRQLIWASNRHLPHAYFMVRSDAALINLKRRPDDTSVPKNPRETGNQEACHEKICYPAFAAPLALLHLTNFRVTIEAQEVYAQLKETVYVSLFHARTTEGRGEIQIAASDITPQAGYLFPTERSTFATDQELGSQIGCPLTQMNCEGITENHAADDFSHKYTQHLYDPLDGEDVFRNQYTFGYSPVQAIAGFYDPRFLIIGDADMNEHEVVNWGRLLSDLDGRTDLHSCLQPEFKHSGNAKPIYSYLDTTDPEFPMKYYRQRYAPHNYGSADGHSSGPPQTGIFEAIGMEDRLLLITNKGLVSFYGHTNVTASLNKAWKYTDEEIINKCFKIVRMLPKGQPNYDLIVGITYTYTHYNLSGDESHEVNQEIWVGHFVYQGNKIQWEQLTAKADSSHNLESWIYQEDKKRGDLVALPPVKGPILSAQSHESSPRSQVEAICFKAYRTEFWGSPGVQIHDNPGWCEALDATPVQFADAIQVLVRMMVFHEGSDRKVYFYVIATHRLHVDSELSWQIDSVIPRNPCVNDHPEAIDNVFTLDPTYFGGDGKSDDNLGCHEENLPENELHLNGITYTRTLNSHLFVYGSRLLQSINLGKHFIFLRSFPEKYQEDHLHVDNMHEKGQALHRIVKMAFDVSGHYAFLTNRKELWIGSTGSITQIRLRPSPVQSMVQLGISKVRNINDGVPFTVDFDSNDVLYEMVAILDETGHVSRVIKRPVNEWKLLGNQALFDKLKDRSEKMVNLRATPGANYSSLHMPIHYDVSKWSSFCPYASPVLRQNFSRLNRRLIEMFFPHPDQHLSLGKSHIPESLMTFQVATFSLVWKSLFNPPERFYEGYDEDPFKVWTDLKQDQETVAVLQFFQKISDSSGVNARENGLLVNPSKYKRLILSSPSDFLLNYWLDYNIVVEIQLGFSLKNDFLVANRDYRSDDINLIQINVENSNGSVIQINTEKEVSHHEAAVKFIIRMSLKRGIYLPQNLPGRDVIPIPVTYHLVGAFGKCIQNKAQGIIGDRVETVAVVGCPHSRHFVFDWNATLHSIRLRNDRVKLGAMPHGVGKLCYHGEFACFFARSALVLHFSIFDEPRQAYLPYNGKYVMRVVGSGRKRKQIRRYTDEEIAAFNIPGVSDVSLIWTKWDSENHRRIKAEEDENIRPEHIDSRETILVSRESAVMWVCHTLSPCARIAPTSNFEVVYWFRIFVTNRGVDPDTLCLFEKEFDIMLYGFPPAPELQLLATLGFSFIMLSVLYIMFLCARRKARVWRHTKSTVLRWWYIVKDAIPKKLRMYEPPLPEEDKQLKSGKKGGRKFGSYELLQDRSAESLEGEDSAKFGSNVSSTSIVSSSSAQSRSDLGQILPKVKFATNVSEKDATTYDVLLSHRLNTIVERNRVMRENLLKKASINAGTWEVVENEETFERQFGVTASNESLFTPPLPKNRKGGLDSFI